MSVPFAPIGAVATLFAGFPCPWFVAGGWAIDLFIGAVTRPHEDIEIAIFREDQEALHTFLTEWTLDYIDDLHGPATFIPWQPGIRLALPLFQIRACREGDNPAQLDMFLTDAPDGTWQFRRNPAVTRPRSEMGIRSEVDNIPCVAPEITLLYKAKYHRPKDEQDFQVTAPRLAPAQRAWLCAALQKDRPGDPWLTELQ